MNKYLNRVGTSLSILLNVLLGGKSNQTLSARQYQRMRDGKSNLVWFIDGVFFLEEDHCMEAWIKWEIISRAIKHYDKEFKFDEYERQ
jgi:hypothetical protein